MAKAERLTDDFVAATLDVAWATDGPGVTLGGGLVSLDISTTQCNLKTTGAWDLTGSAFWGKIVFPDSGRNGTDQNSLRISTGTVTNTANELRFFRSGATSMDARYTIGGTNTTLATWTYSATTHAWLRVREAAGTVYWDTSPDGMTWTTQASTAAITWDLTTVYLRVTASRFGAETTAAVIVDRINTTAADTGTGTDVAVSIALTGQGDTGAGVEGTPTLGLSAADTATGTEGTPTLAMSAADTGAGTDAAVRIALAVADTAAGVEGQALAAAAGAADTASATDAAVRIALAATESGVGTDAAAVLAAAAATADSGTGLDAPASLASALASTDLGIGTDAGAAAVALAATDSATVADAGSVHVQDSVVPVSAADTGAGADAGMVAAALGGVDQGAGVDTPLALGAAVTGADSAAAADTASLTAAAAAADTGAGTDTGAASVQIGAADSTVGVDDQTVVGAVADADTATALEAVRVAVGAADASGPAGDTALSVAAALAAGDVADAVEAVSVLAALAAGEAARARDDGAAYEPGLPLLDQMAALLAALLPDEVAWSPRAPYDLGDPRAPITITRIPARPDRVVTLFLPPTEIPQDRWAAEVPFQVRVRGDADPRTSETLAQRIAGALRDVYHRRLLGGTWLGLVHVSAGRPGYLGPDGNRRHQHVLNARLFVGDSNPTGGTGG